ncbi:mitochondrial 18 KDa protein-domain-containing protein [Chlamydoabsidia padenii]|nr:mitochondrial 18 KDa protein-domain-containing protein [Chlamydoabsidia padenii]
MSSNNGNNGTSPVDKTASQHSLTERVEEGEVNTIDTKARYLAYASRLKTAMTASSRYLAYSSDIGESFRPIVPPAVVKAAYGISWGYVLIDMSYEGYKAHHAGDSNQEVAVKMAQRGTFQAVASMFFPMVTIHTAVKYSAKAFKDVKNTKLRTWGPTAIGLAIVPFLPYMFDEPVEHVMDRIFEPLKIKARSDSSTQSTPSPSLQEKKTQ